MNLKKRRVVRKLAHGEPLKIYRGSRSKAYSQLLLCCAIIGLAIYLLQGAEPWSKPFVGGWGCVVVFIPMALLNLATLLWPPRLEIYAGFVVNKHLFGTHKIAFKNVSAFKVADIGRYRVAHIVCSQRLMGETKERQHAIPLQSYDFPTMDLCADLCEELNQLRQKSLEASAATKKAPNP